MLNRTERAGNALPHPATLFGLFALSVLLVSALGHLLAWEVIHPGTNEIVRPVNLLSREGIHRILLEMVDNFTGFAPLGIVLVAMLGIGTIVATMIPYSVVFLVFWILLLILWLAPGIPLGPGAGIYYNLPV